jgi:GNAT superfamily N-acetyltransferase
MVTIRPATQHDQAAINSLIRQVGINPLGVKWRRFLIGVNDAGALVGCGQVKPHRDGSRELASIAVEQAWRGQGIGKALVSELQRVHGPPVWLTCRSELRPFYSASGFVEITDPGKMPPYFRRVKRLAELVRILTLGKFRLAVMSWHAPPPS